MTKIPVTVYTKSNCVQCDSTKRTMDKLGIRYSVVNLETNPDIAQKFIDQGHLAAPIVTTDTKIWSGFRLEKIQNLANFIESLRAKGEDSDPFEQVVEILSTARARYAADGNHLDASAMELAIAVIKGEAA